MKITFLTLNVWSGGIYQDRIVRFIKKIDPDIINFQEVYHGDNIQLGTQFRTLSIFQEKLPYKYTAFAPSFLNEVSGIPIAFGNATFSKFPIIKYNATFYDIPFGVICDETEQDHSLQPRNITHATIAINQNILNVFNTHGSWGTNGNDNSRRLTMSKKIISETKGLSKVILSGDFNTEPHTKTIKNIEKHLVNIFKNQLHTTFNMQQKKGGNFASSVVDYIFVGKDLSVIHKDALQVNISDHLPLVCTIEV